MIAVFLSDPALWDPIRAALAGLSPTFQSNRARFEELVPTTKVAVLVIPSVDDDAEVAWFRRLAASHSGKSWILVTETDAEKVAGLIHWSGVSDVVWKSRILEDLRPTVEKLLSTGPITGFVTILEGSGMESEEISQFLREASLCRPLPTTISGLCLKLGVRESRIRYLWPGFFQRGHSPKEFLDTLVLVHSLDLHDSLGSWEKVAEVLHIGERTLRDICHRITGLGLRDAKQKAREQGLNFLQEWWLRSRVS